MFKQEAREEIAIVLDFLPNGYPFDTRPMHRKTAIVQAMGKEHFLLLELVPKKGIFLQPHEEVYMGEGKRDKIHHIIGKIPSEKLTQTAQSELNVIVEDIVNKDEKRFVEFFNKSQPINTRRHQIQLLPGIGKKHMLDILEKRAEKPFESFEDIKERVRLIPDPNKLIIKRILIEIRGEDKYKLFLD
jgi:putative nucleotide binding protein